MIRVRTDAPPSTPWTVAVLAAGVVAFGLLQSLIIPVLSQVQERFDTADEPNVDLARAQP